MWLIEEDMMSLPTYTLDYRVGNLKHQYRFHTLLDSLKWLVINKVADIHIYTLTTSRA